MKFNWDEGKRQWLLKDREIDLANVTEVFDGRFCYTITSHRDGEERFVTVAERGEKLFAVVWMWRNDTIWLITARRAWKKEEQNYKNLKTA